jgi:hypothetical protein
VYVLGDIAERIAELDEPVPHSLAAIEKGECSRLIVLAIPVQHFMRRAELQQVSLQHDVVFCDRIHPTRLHVGQDPASCPTAAREEPALPDVRVLQLFDIRLDRASIQLPIGRRVLVLRQGQSHRTECNLELHGPLGKQPPGAEARPVARQLVSHPHQVTDVTELHLRQLRIVVRIDGL